VAFHHVAPDDRPDVLRRARGKRSLLPAIGMKVGATLNGVRGWAVAAPDIA
jgi:hypothetical protein